MVDVDPPGKKSTGPLQPVAKRDLSDRGQPQTTRVWANLGSGSDMLSGIFRVAVHLGTIAGEEDGGALQFRVMRRRLGPRRRLRDLRVLYPIPSNYKASYCLRLPQKRRHGYDK